MRHPLPVVAVAGVALLLTACAPSGFPEFEREQVASDRPDVVVDFSTGELDVETLRYVGEAEGYEVYLSRGAEGGTSLCLTLVQDDAWQTSACGEMDQIGIQVGESAAINASADDHTGEGRDYISDSVWVSRG